MADKPATDHSASAVFGQIIELLDRLDRPHENYGDFLDRAEWARRPTTRRVSDDSDGEWVCSESWADSWHGWIVMVRAYVGLKGSAVEAERAADALLSFIADLRRPLREEWLATFAGEPVPAPRAVPPDLMSDVGRLHSLLRSILPRECESCRKTFRPAQPDASECRQCRTGRGKYSEIWTKLHCHWHYKEPIYASDQVAWEDFRSAFRKRYGKFPEQVGAGWVPDRKIMPSDQSPTQWHEFEDDCRTWLIASGVPRENWRVELTRTPICEVTAWLSACDKPLQPQKGDTSTARASLLAIEPQLENLLRIAEYEENREGRAIAGVERKLAELRGEIQPTVGKSPADASGPVDHAPFWMFDEAMQLEKLSAELEKAGRPNESNAIWNYLNDRAKKSLTLPASRATARRTAVALRREIDGSGATQASALEAASDSLTAHTAELLSNVGKVKADFAAKDAEIARLQKEADAAGTNGMANNAEVDLHRLAEAVGDEVTVEILRIARTDRPAEKRMQAIIRLDPRFVGKDSNKWGTLLRVQPSRIRQMSTWKNRRLLTEADKAGWSSG